MDDSASRTHERDLAADLEVALDLAERADAFTLPRFEAADFTLGWKDDRTEITEVDRSCETLLADRIAATRPDDALFGEEYGLRGDPAARWRWIVDPIDGTAGFVRGIPVWGTLIALLRRDPAGPEELDGSRADRWRPVVAAVSAPALGRRWWAAAGAGAFADGRPCHVSDVAVLADAQVSVIFNSGWERVGRTMALMSIVDTARRARGFGDFWQHCLVAEGALDLAVDAIGLGMYDIAPIQLLVEEAGGRVTDRHGVVDLSSDSAISSNGALHDEVIARLA